jgi:hypothetical protein
MNKELDRLIEKYNSGQDYCQIKHYTEGNVFGFMFLIEKSKVFVKEKGNVIKFTGSESQTRWVGFYEWLFNPKYKVFEVFGFDNPNDLWSICHDYKIMFKPVPEIIKYLAKEI